MRLRAGNFLFAVILLAELFTPLGEPKAKAQKAEAMPKTYTEAREFLGRHAA